jgi:hypothetical protein
MKNIKSIQELFILWDIQEEINKKAIRLSNIKRKELDKSIFIKEK